MSATQFWAAFLREKLEAARDMGGYVELSQRDVESLLELIDEKSPVR